MQADKLLLELQKLAINVQIQFKAVDSIRSFPFATIDTTRSYHYGLCRLAMHPTMREK